MHTLNKYTGIIIRVVKRISNKAILHITDTLLFIFLIGLVFTSCTQESEKAIRDGLNPYSISLGAFKSYEQALQFRQKLSNSIRADLRLEYVSKKKYKLLFGKYPSSIKAGEKAFRLLENKEITDYEITRDGQRVLDEFCNVPFISKFLGNGAIYNFNLRTKQPELLWSRKYEEVIALNLTDDAKYAFALTAKSYSTRSSIPSIKEAKLYFLRRNEDIANEIIELGDVNQIYTYWDSRDTFRINCTFPNSLNPRIIYQRILTYDSNGNLKYEKDRSFDLLIQGFPVPPKRKPSYLSPNGKFEIRHIENKSESFYYLRNLEDHSEELIHSSRSGLYDMRWSDDGLVLFLLTKNKLKNNGKKFTKKDEIVIVDASARKVVQILGGTNLQNLLLRGKFLFFDERLPNLSRIIIYDLEKTKLFKTLDFYGGCSLNTIP